MGVLIAMTSSVSPPRFRPKRDGDSAEILFFTGVRYYRMPDAVTPSEPKRRRRRPASSRADAPRYDCQA